MIELRGSANHITRLDANIKIVIFHALLFNKLSLWWPKQFVSCHQRLDSYFNRVLDTKPLSLSPSPVMFPLKLTYSDRCLILMEHCDNGVNVGILL